QESGDRVVGKYRLDGKSKLVDTGGTNSFTYFLTTDHSKYLTTYSCKSYSDQSIKVYGAEKNTHVRDYLKNFTKIAGNMTKSVHFHEVDQNGCKSFAPVANKDFVFIEDDLYSVEFAKLQGNWVQKATTLNTSDHFYLKCTAKVVGSNHSQSTINSKTSTIGNSRVCLRDFANATNPIKLYDYRLYFDGQYLITFSVPLSTDSSTTPPYLEVIMKDHQKGESDFDLITLYDILLNRLRPNARKIVESFIYDLNYKDEENPNANTILKKCSIQFTEEELATVAFEKISNVYELRFSTDPYNVFDIQVSLIAGKYLKTYSQKGNDLVRNITDIRLPNSKRIFRVTNNKFSEVSYLYIDESFLLTFECYHSTEHLRLYARQSVPNDESQYKQVLDKIKSSAKDKLNDFVSKMKVHVESGSDTLI
ncbi:unnamed protein product, partial [Medioppia subpectinata]